MNWNRLLRQWHRLLGYLGYEPESMPSGLGPQSEKTQPGVRVGAVDGPRSPLVPAKAIAPAR
jgi:hypothetical protein